MWPSVEQIPHLLEEHAIKLVTALAILILGWLIALVLSGVTRKILRRSRLDTMMNRLAASEGGTHGISLEAWIARGIFYFLMLFVFVAFFEALGLSLINDPLNHFMIRVFEYAPRLIGPLVLIFLAWIVASALKVVTLKVMGNPRLNHVLVHKLGLDTELQRSVTGTLGNVIYWVVFLIFSLAVLESLDMQGILEPLQQMLQKILGFLPNVLGALLILGVGWFLARVVQRIVTNLLATMGTDRLSDQMGLRQVLGRQSLAALIGLIAYVVVLIPVLIASLNALRLDAITDPAINLLNRALAAVPSVFAAVLVLGTAFLVGQVIARLVTNLLTSAGFNTILARMGAGKDPTDFNSILSRLGVGDETTEGKRTFSEIAGYLVLVGIMLFAAIEALDLVGLMTLSEALTQFLRFVMQVVLGLVIFATGLFMAHVATQAILSSGTPNAKLLSVTARTSILALAGAMALQQMGLARDIITLAFGLILGAIAVAFAIAFGIGGKDVASQLLKEFVLSIRAKSKTEHRP